MTDNVIQFQKEMQIEFTPEGDEDEVENAWECHDHDGVGIRALGQGDWDRAFCGAISASGYFRLADGVNLRAICRDFKIGGRI